LNLIEQVKLINVRNLTKNNIECSSMYVKYDFKWSMVRCMSVVNTSRITGRAQNLISI